MTIYRLAEKQHQHQGIVYNILNQHLDVQGKLLRSTLTKKLGCLFGLDEVDCDPISWASELIHNASLIHDDVVDEAHVRRDRPTLNTRMSNARAVLAGDYLLASVIAELVRLKKYEILGTLSETLEEIVEGEFLQDSLKEKASVGVEDLRTVSEKKTGALIAWNCESVGVTARLSEGSTKKLRQLGLKLGLAFQMLDDNIDYLPTSGKEFAKDLKEGLINFTTLNLIRLHPELYYTIYQIRGTAFSEVPWHHSQLQEAMAKTLSDANNLFAEVYALLDEVVRAEGRGMNEAYGDLVEYLRALQGRNR